MQNLFSLSTQSEARSQELSDAEKYSILYHNIFDYPLSFPDLVKWTTSESVWKDLEPPNVVVKNGYYFVEGKEGIVYKRMLRKRISAKKLEIAKKAARVLSFVPGVKMVAVTGSLAMENATDESDIDTMVITKGGSLWTTRLFAYSLIRLLGIRTRRPHDNNQRDALCLNMWLDESDLVWRGRNVYSAHEIGQIRPLVNKDFTYEKFLNKNQWILNYWPNAVGKKYIGNSMSNIGKSKSRYTIYDILTAFIEKLAYRIQYQYMKPKISREVITPTRALFHPHDWGKVVLSRLHT